LIFNGETLATPDGLQVVFAKVGAELELASTADRLAVIRGRGANFFSYTFPLGHTTRKFPLVHPGTTVVTMGSGEFPARAEVFVSQHPYWAITNASGQFEFPEVPPGTYDLRVYIRDWVVSSAERDPESGLIARLNYGPDLVFRQTVTVTPGGAETVTVRFDPSTRGGHGQ
jgi:hypothetical protein